MYDNSKDKQVDDDLLNKTHGTFINKGTIEEIAAERKRQVEKEGWSPEHDDHHNNGELAFAAAYYAIPFGDFKDFAPVEVDGKTTMKPVGLFPFDKEWDKKCKHKRRKQLIISAALIVAEIERLDRANTKTSK